MGHREIEHDDGEAAQNRGIGATMLLQRLLDKG
jgi:hypothetical protein